MTLSTTLWYSKKRWHCSVPFATIASLYYSKKKWHCSIPFATIAFRTDRPFLHFIAVVSICFLEVSILLDWIPRCLRWLVCSAAAPSNVTAGIAIGLPAALFAPECLCLVRIDERFGVMTPLGYNIQLLLHCFSRTVMGSYTNPLMFCIWGRYLPVWESCWVHFGSDLPGLWCRHWRGPARAVILVVGPLWADEEQSSSFQAA